MLTVNTPQEVVPDTISTQVVGAKPTKKGSLLIRIGDFSNKIFENEVPHIVREMSKMQNGRKATLEIRDLHCLT